MIIIMIVARKKNFRVLRKSQVFLSLLKFWCNKTWCKQTYPKCVLHWIISQWSNKSHKILYPFAIRCSSVKKKRLINFTNYFAKPFIHSVEGDLRRLKKSWLEKTHLIYSAPHSHKNLGFRGKKRCLGNWFEIYSICYQELLNPNWFILRQLYFPFPPFPHPLLSPQPTCLPLALPPSQPPPSLPPGHLRGGKVR